MLSIGCGILIALPLVITPSAPINWLKKKANTALFYCKKGVKPMKYAILGYLALKCTARITRNILESEIPYREKNFEDIPGLKHIMPSNDDKNIQIHYLKAIPWAIGSLYILGYIRHKCEKRKEKGNSSNFF
jgi:hypothetical protein